MAINGGEGIMELLSTFLTTQQEQDAMAIVF